MHILQYLINRFTLLLGCILLASCSFVKFNPPAKAIKTATEQAKTDQANNQNQLEILERLAALGDPNANFKLAEIYVATDLPKAKELFKKAADHGLPIAMVRLGNMYRDGLLGDPSLPIAISWYEKAAAAGNIKAMLSLGEIYRGLYGMTPNYNQSINFYIQAAGLGSIEAEYQIAMLITNNLVDKNKYAAHMQTTMDALRKAANKGNLDAIVAVGDYYMQQPNIKLALEYYNKAAQQNFAPALSRLGLLYFNGDKVQQNYKSAMEFFHRSAASGNTISEYYLGEMYRKGLGVPKDRKAASLWYAKAADQHFAKSVVRLADLYFAGKGVPADIYKAIELYKKAAAAGDSYSSLLLSILYAKGIGVEQHLPSSVHWYNMAEKNKDQAVAKFEIATAYETGFGFKQSYEDAAAWYLLAAQQGLAKAQAKLADLYVNGLGVPQDYKLAVKWYKAAAEQGHYYAQYSLALLLPTIQQYRPSLAYSVMKKAALGGYRPAQYNLGLMYLYGKGVKSNPIKAYGWLSMAVDSLGSDQEFMNNVINQLDPDARNKAVLLAERYRKRYEVEQQQ